MNVENLKRIIYERKTTLSSLRKIDWRRVKAKTEKKTDLLTHISTKNITGLNELFYTGAKLV